MLTDGIADAYRRGRDRVAGTDGVRDAWGPLNGESMLERAYLISYLNGFRDDEGLALAHRMASTNAASVLGLAHYGLEPGCEADFILLDVENVAEAVAAHPTPSLVVKRGAVVARSGRACVAPM